MEIRFKETNEHETREERKKRLYKVGNILSNEDHTFLVMIAVDGEGSYFMLDLKSGKQVGSYKVDGLDVLADVFFDENDVLVTALTVEVEEN